MIATVCRYHHLKRLETGCWRQRRFSAYARGPELPKSAPFLSSTVSRPIEVRASLGMQGGYGVLLYSRLMIHTSWALKTMHSCLFYDFEARNYYYHPDLASRSATPSVPCIEAVHGCASFAACMHRSIQYPIVDLHVS